MSAVDSVRAKYDLRQYELLHDRLEAFTRAVVSLHKLIEDLRGLAEALEHPDAAWKEKFLGDWWTLEQVYAVALDRDELYCLPAESEELVATAVASMKAMVLAAIRSVRGVAGNDS